MAFETPPWLDVKPSDFVRAGQMGAEAGIAARRQYSSEVEAGDRLRLAYDTLASQERRESERVAAQQELAAMKLDMQMQQQDAAMALREQQAAALNAYRDARLGQYDVAEGRRQDAAASLEDYRAKSLDLKVQRQADLAKKAEDLRQWRESVEARKMAEMSPIDRAELQSSLSRLNTIQRELDKELQFGVMLDPGVRQRLENEQVYLYDRLYDLRQRYPANPLKPAPAPATGTAASAALSPTATTPPGPSLLSLQPSPTPNLTLQLPSGRGALSMSTGTTAPPVSEPALSLALSPATGTAPSGRVFVDKTGTRWIYTGTAENPKTDQNPDHWAQQ